jgi:hypothetical protein
MMDDIRKASIVLVAWLVRHVSLASYRSFVLVVAFAVPILMSATQSFPVPRYDSLDYLAYARSLYFAGTYSRTLAGPEIDELPGREPLYSLFIAGLAHFDPMLSQTLATCNPPEEHCKSDFRHLAFANGILLACSTILVSILVNLLGGSPVASLVAGAYVGLNLHICLRRCGM